MSEQRVSALARLVTLATLEANRHMLSLNVFVKRVDRALEVAICALPTPVHLHHPGPDQPIRGLVHLITNKACSSETIEGTGM